MGRPLCAQRRASLDLGLSAVRFPDDTLNVFGPFAALTISERTARWFGAVSAGGVATGDGASGSAELSGGTRVPLRRQWLGELSSEVGTILGPQQTAAGSMLFAGRLLRPIGSGGAWLRGSGDVAWRESGRLGGRGVDVGAWWQWWRAELTTSIARQWNMAQLFVGPGRGTPVGTVPVSYTEAQLSARLEGDAGSVAVAGAVRRDRDAPQLYSPAVSATAAYRLAANRALTVSVARQLPDFVRGGDAVDYISVGMRIAESAPRALRDARAGPTIQIGPGAVDSLRVLSVRAPAARGVEVRADFTGWEPIRLTPKDDYFVRALPMTPGTHRIVVRIDGGPWMPAANTPPVDDDFGGRVGLLLVP